MRNSNRLSHLQRQAERRRREYDEREQKLAAAASSPGRPINSDELVELRIDIKQLGGERVPDAGPIIARMVEAPAGDPELPQLAAALLERELELQAGAGHDGFDHEHLRKLIRAFRLRPLAAEQILLSDPWTYRVLHLSRRPRSRWSWWRRQRTVCGKNARKLAAAGRGEWQTNHHRRCGRCGAHDWSRIRECFEGMAEVEFDDLDRIDEEAIEIGSRRLLAAVLEIRAGVSAECGRFGSHGKYLAGEILEEAWGQAARRDLLRQIVARGDEALITLVRDKAYWRDRIPALLEQLPVGVDALVDLLGKDALYDGATPSDLLLQINNVIVEREVTDDETFDERMRDRRLAAETAEQERLRAELKRQTDTSAVRGRER